MAKEPETITPWVGFGFELTLVTLKEDGTIGPPVPPMIDLVKRFLEKGVLVKIISPGLESYKTGPFSEKAIKKWCLKHLGVELQVTNKLDGGLISLYTAMVHQINPNKGQLLEHMLEHAAVVIDQQNNTIQKLSVLVPPHLLGLGLKS